MDDRSPWPSVATLFFMLTMLAVSVGVWTSDLDFIESRATVTCAPSTTVEPQPLTTTAPSFDADRLAEALRSIPESSNTESPRSVQTQADVELSIEFSHSDRHNEPVEPIKIETAVEMNADRAPAAAIKLTPPGGTANDAIQNQTSELPFSPSTRPRALTESVLESFIPLESADSIRTDDASPTEAAQRSNATPIHQAAKQPPYESTSQSPDKPAAKRVQFTLTDQTEVNGSASSADESLIDDNAETEETTESQPFWPNPESLTTVIAPLADMPALTEWHRQTAATLQRLEEITSLPSGRLDLLLDQLDAQAVELWTVAGSYVTGEPDDEAMRQAALLSRISYDLQRRASVWRAVNQLADSMATTPDPARLVGQPIVYSRWNFGEIHQLWQDYLELDQLFTGELDKRQQAARMTLARLHSAGLDNAQREYIQGAIPDLLERELRQAATHQMNLRQLLESVEQYHQRENGYTAHVLNQHFQNALWSDQPELAPLATAINHHYRNANFRATISKSLINRMLTQPVDFDEPVRDSILGATVTGKSRVTSQLSIELIPDPESWNLTLNTNGKILSHTQARRDGFVFHSVGNTDVYGSKRIAIGYDGVHAELSNVEAVMDQEVVGLNSPFDSLPLLGWTARRMAQRRQQQTEPIANQQARSKIRARVQQRIEDEVGTALGTVRQQFREVFIEPMIAAELEPQAIEMSTTESDLVVRYRLAGFDQLAGNTPRPMTDGSPALSFQLHESAVNNMIDRLEIAGQTFSIESLQQHLRERLPLDQLPQKDANADGRKVEMQFAPFDPMRVDFTDGQIQITLNFRKFQIGDSEGWRNVTVRTQYEAEFDGFHCVLRQQGGVKASGRRIPVREELAIGAIFDHVLEDEYRFTAFPAEELARFQQLKIQLSHFLVSDGWISVAYDDDLSRVMIGPERTGSRRIGDFRR